METSLAIKLLALFVAVGLVGGGAFFIFYYPMMTTMMIMTYRTMGSSATSRLVHRTPTVTV